MEFLKIALLAISLTEVASGQLLQELLSPVREITEGLIDVTSRILSTKTDLSEDGKLNFTALAKKYGHDCEEFDVTTEDGYILKLFHIPGDNKKTVLLNHGLLDSSDTYITRNKKSLSLTLASLGYDVWAMNNRGNRYSRNHVTINPDTDKKEFFDYSFHEIGIYDVPANIDFILKFTQNDKLSYIGHSQGTSALLVMASEKPEYNKKLKVAALLAPAAYYANIKGLFALIPELNEVVMTLFKVLNITEFIGYNSSTARLVRFACTQGLLGYKLCTLVIFLMSGFDYKRFERAHLPTAIGHFPAGTSTKSLIHYSQLIKSEKFRQFDYGEKNIDQYCTDTPPEYDLSKVTADIAMFCSKNDFLASLKDTAALKAQLGNVVKYYVMKPRTWNHLDFVLANDLEDEFHPVLIDLLNEY